MLANIPTVVKNLLIINVLMFIATEILSRFGFNLHHLFGLHHWSSDLFMPHQFITYMFMHAGLGAGGIAHIFFNMFALWMFGKVLEQVWGPKRFLVYYMVTGIGAGILQMIVVSIGLSNLENAVSDIAASNSSEAFAVFINDYIPANYRSQFLPILADWIKFPESSQIKTVALDFSNQWLEMKRNIGTVGASGSVFGILLAFGMLFPNTELFLLFPPIPIKAKYFVIGYGVIELYMGFSSNPSDNVAHFAHLGGMLFGFILIKYWKKNTNYFY